MSIPSSGLKSKPSMKQAGKKRYLRFNIEMETTISSEKSVEF
jgi:hypothetical protein